MTDTELDEFIDELFATLLSMGAKGAVATYKREDNGDIVADVRFTLEGGE